jgi:4'-phosphopantetheinyl transferase
MRLEPRMQAPAVLRWPQDRALTLDALQRGQTVVLCIAQSPGTKRPTARANVRLALQAALGVWLGCSAMDVVLQNFPGTPIRIQHPTSTAALSVSHEEGLSLAAIAPIGSVGVDLLAIATLPDSAECLRLARDYLGPGTLLKLTALPAAAVPMAFALGWAQREAHFKCAGLALTEWRQTDPTAREYPDLQTLSLPAGHVGALARSKSPAPFAERPEPRSRSSS